MEFSNPMAPPEIIEDEDEDRYSPFEIQACFQR